jgi:hypothetical protein
MRHPIDPTNLHVEYQGAEAVVSLPDGELIKGSLPVNKLRLLQAWITILEEELMAGLGVGGQGRACFQNQAVALRSVTMIRVDSVLPGEDYTLRLTFNNGEIRCFDMRPYLNLPVYRRLAEPRVFRPDSHRLRNRGLA